MSDFPPNLSGSIVVISRVRVDDYLLCYARCWIERETETSSVLCSHGTCMPSHAHFMNVSVQGDCRFLLKAWLAMLNGASAMVVVDNVNSANAPIMSSGSEYIPQQLLPFVSVAVTRSTGLTLVNTYNEAQLDNEVFVLRIAPMGDDVIINGNGGNSISGQTKLASRFVFYTSGVVIFGVIILMSVRFCRRSDRFLPVYIVEDRELPEADLLLAGLHSYVYGGGNKDVSTRATGPAKEPHAPEPKVHGLNEKRTAASGPAVPGATEKSSYTVEPLDMLNHSDAAVASCKSDHENEDVHTGGRCDDADADEEDTCCICLAAYSTGNVITALPCTHNFHGDCIGPWLRLHRECPLCKRDVYLMHFEQDAVAPAPPNIVVVTDGVDVNGAVRGPVATPLARSSSSSSLASLTSLASSSSWSSTSSGTHVADVRLYRRPPPTEQPVTELSSDESLLAFTPERPVDMLGPTRTRAEQRVATGQRDGPHAGSQDAPSSRRMLILPLAGLTSMQDVTVL